MEFFCVTVAELISTVTIPKNPLTPNLEKQHFIQLTSGGVSAVKSVLILGADSITNYSESNLLQCHIHPLPSQATAKFRFKMAKPRPPSPIRDLTDEPPKLPSITC